MANVTWPSSPTVGQIYQFGTLFWIYTATGGWKAIPNANQVNTGWILVGPWIFAQVTDFDIGWEADNYTWEQVTYL
jgi:hypothetical protein